MLWCTLTPCFLLWGPSKSPAHNHCEKLKGAHSQTHGISTTLFWHSKLHNSNCDFYTTTVWKNLQIDTQVFAEGLGMMTWSLLGSEVQEAFSGSIFACEYVCFKSSFETNASLNLFISIWDLGFPTLIWVTQRSHALFVSLLRHFQSRRGNWMAPAVLQFDGTERAAARLWFNCLGKSLHHWMVWSWRGWRKKKPWQMWF